MCECSIKKLFKVDKSAHNTVKIHKKRRADFDCLRELVEDDKEVEDKEDKVFVKVKSVKDDKKVKSVKDDEKIFEKEEFPTLETNDVDVGVNKNSEVTVTFKDILSKKPTEPKELIREEKMKIPKKVHKKVVIHEVPQISWKEKVQIWNTDTKLEDKRVEESKKVEEVEVW